MVIPFPLGTTLRVGSSTPSAQELASAARTRAIDNNFHPGVFLCRRLPILRETHLAQRHVSPRIIKPKVAQFILGCLGGK